MPPYAVSLADEPPAIHAPAPSSDQAESGAEAPATESSTAPGWLSARGALTLGGGSSGLAGLVGLEVDAWPLRWLGFGLEGVRGATDEVTLGEPGDSDTFQAEHLRVSGRWVLRGGGIAVVTLAGGIGRHTERKISCTGDCERFPDEGFGPDTIVEAGTSASGALEAGVYVRRDQLHLGFVARGDITGPVYAVTLGPVLGLEF